MSCVVYTPGVWDLLHVGHLNFLERARALGDKLVVGVADDDVVEMDKGVKPVITAKDRVRMLNALKCVYRAQTYFEFEFLTHLNKFGPRVLAVGEYWGKERRHLDAEEWAKDNGCSVVRLTYTKGVSSTEIKSKIGAGNGNGLRAE